MAELVGYAIRDGVAVVTVDNPPVNALSPGVPESIEEAISRAGADPSARAVVLIGAGSTFIAGADIRFFETIPSREASIERSHAIHARLRRMEDCPKPVVAAIHGTALGGGMEFAMACHYRVAVPSAKVGQPEVLLGIIPGAGGTQRLPRLAGIATALEMCTQGNHISAARALKEGAIDRVIEGDLLTGAIQFALEQAGPRRTRDLPVKPASTDEVRAALKKTARGARAPFACVEAIEAAMTLGFDAGCEREIQLFADCVLSSESKAMVKLFFAEREASKVPGV
ncbi:MAG: enoyl-CoA hydratase/isomerase family protein, partial [Candidatus Solibacter usitatus]|nr:enoyl-CoA hydratase/isomerase family protein [Candidatus Solibacter usitatus]